jgi:hypothetical protein
VFAAYLVLGQRLYPVPHRPGPLLVVTVVTVVLVLAAAGPVSFGDVALVARTTLPIVAMGLVVGSGLVTTTEIGTLLRARRRTRHEAER